MKLEEEIITQLALIGLKHTSILNSFKMSQNQQRKTKKKQKKVQKQMTLNSGPFSHPRQIPNYNLKHRCRMRFLVSATLTAQQISWNNLIDTVNFVTAAVSLYNIFRSVKINEIEIWDTSALGAASSLALLWNESDTNLSGDQKMVTDISMGVVPAHIRSKPPIGTLSREWHIGAGPNTTNAFAIWTSASAVVDVDLSFKSGTTGVSNGANVACVGGIIGAVAFRGLDGLAVLTSKFLCPIGVYQL